MGKGEKESTSIEIDPCTGFPVTHKAKLSIPTIIWHKYGKAGDSSGLTEQTVEATSTNQISSLHQEIRKNLLLRYIGLVFTVLSAFTFSLNVLIIKPMRHWHPFTLGLWKFLLMTLFSIGPMVYEVKVKKNETLFENFQRKNSGKEKAAMFYRYILARAFFGTSAFILFFYSVKYLDSADTFFIMSASPICVCLLAHILFGEKIGVIPIFTGVLVMVGVGFICRPPLLIGSNSKFCMNTLIGMALAFLAMMCISTSLIFLKLLENVHYALVNTVFGLWGTIQCLCMSIATGVLTIPTDPNDILMIVGSAFVFFVGQVFITAALQYEDAGPVGLVRITEVLFILLMEYVSLNENIIIIHSATFCFIGVSLVLLAVFLTTLRKWMGTLPSSSAMRNYPWKIMLH